jgi:DNA-binding response OmpR family regulator
VLVVEDEAIVREMMVEALEDAGFEVDEAATGEKADELLEADGYKLVVTDIHMPGRLSGVDLANLAHAREPGLPIIFVTGRPDVLERFKAPDMIRMTLPKPFTLASLTTAVRKLISQTV